MASRTKVTKEKDNSNSEFFEALSLMEKEKGIPAVLLA